MGHERVGVLPRTKRWQDIVESLSSDSITDPQFISDLAENTLNNVKSRFQNIHRDKGIQAAFGFLISLATNNLPKSGGMSSPDISLEDNPSPVRIAKSLNDWVKKNAESFEYAEIACRAAAETITEWSKSHSEQQLLFDEGVSASFIWEQSSDGRGFCQVARSFFANYTERYLNYFLEREASAHIGKFNDRQTFSKVLENHIDAVSQHAFETSKITQSFAAGWFNKHAKDSRPTDIEIENFLRIAFGKMHEELQREAGK